MKVLSLFDGMSCGRVALDRASIAYTSYHASEIDKYAIKVAKHNYPDTKHVGDVTKLHASKGGYDLLLGGSPCQGFSQAGDQKGFNDPRSRLFWEYVRIKNEVRPKWFLLENVMMKQEWQDIISEALGVQPVMIDSTLLSAQHRKRLYWTNIPIAPIEDQFIMLEDMLEDETKIPVIKSEGHLIYKPYKSQCITASYGKGADNHRQRTGCIQVGEAVINGHDFLKRVYSPKGKCPTLTAVCGGNQERKIAVDASHWRKLTPIECERVQGLPDGYTSVVSNSQRYKMIGNGWQVDTITHIFQGLK